MHRAAVVPDGKIADLPAPSDLVVGMFGELAEHAQQVIALDGD